MAAKTSWHRYGTMEQNYVTVTLCIAYEETKNECKKSPKILVTEFTETTHVGLVTSECHLAWWMVSGRYS